MATSLPIAPKPGPLIPADPLALDHAIAYGEGAIVSRNLLRGKGGGLTLFAFDAGQELSPHSAPFDAVVTVLEGRLRLTIGERTVEAPAGSATLMPADIPHALVAIERTRMLLAMVR